jgi:hypothetical protein
MSPAVNASGLRGSCVWPVTSFLGGMAVVLYGMIMKLKDSTQEKSRCRNSIRKTEICSAAPPISNRNWKARDGHLQNAVFVRLGVKRLKQMVLVVKYSELE